VSGEGIEICPQFSHIHANVGHCLSAINDGHTTYAVNQFCHGFDIIDSAKDIGNLRNGQDLGPLRDETF